MPRLSSVDWTHAAADARTTEGTLLIGMGNPILSDDAIGVRLAHDCARLLELGGEVSVVEECSVGGLNLLDIVAGYQRLIVLDSIKTTGGMPGTWYRFTARSLRETMNLNNIHDANFATTLELGRRMGIPLPDDDDIHIFAVEIDDNTTFSERMTPALEESYPALLQEIWRELAPLVCSGADPSLQEVSTSWR